MTKKAGKKKEESSRDEDEIFYLMCQTEYNKKEDVVQWTLLCKMWAHWDCAEHDTFYICINCISDEDSFFE